jgi:hypothetical protein
MRALPAVVLATLLAGGCVRNDQGAVLLHLDERSPELFLPLTYGSSSAAVSHAAGADVLFTATSDQGVLRVLVALPFRAGDTIVLPDDEQRVDFQVFDNHWGNQGGTVYIISIEPAIIGLIGVPMVPRVGNAAGSFVFNGNGTFRCPTAKGAHCPDLEE